MATIFTRFISLFISVLMFVTAPLALLSGEKQQKISHAEEGCKLSFATISDVHMKNMWGEQKVLELGLYDMEKAEDQLDALVYTGDITDHGYIEMWDRVADAMSKFTPAKESFLVVGNHDTWGPNRDEFDNPVDGVKPTFIKYNKQISDRDISEMYFSDIVNGYYFICLGSEEDHTDAYISDAQLQWFDAEMQKAQATGLPIFVFLHQPIIGTHGLPYNWELDKNYDEDDGGIGAQNDAVVEILKKYDNVFFITGHIHTGLKEEGAKIGVEYASVEYMDNNNGNKITLVNVPCYMYFDFTRGGHFGNGCGYVIEAYENKVLLRGRNFITGKYLTKYDVEVPLVDVSAR